MHSCAQHKPTRGVTKGLPAAASRSTPSHTTRESPLTWAMTCGRETGDGNEKREMHYIHTFYNWQGSKTKGRSASPPCISACADP